MRQLRKIAVLGLAALALVAAPAETTAQDAGQQQARAGGAELTFDREVFVYPGFTRRNPFQSLVGDGGAGPRFEALTLIGFDVFQNRYDMTIVNNFSTATYRASGQPTVDGGAIVLYGNMAEPSLGLHDREVKYIIRRLGDNEWVLEVFDLHQSESGKKVVETFYTRIE